MKSTARSELARLISAAIQHLQIARDESVTEADAQWAVARVGSCLSSWHEGGEAAGHEAFTRAVDEAMRRGVAVPILLKAIAMLPDRVAAALPTDAPPDLQVELASCNRFIRDVLVSGSERLWAKQERQRDTLAAQGRELGELMRLARDSAREERTEELPSLVLAHIARAFGARRGLAWTWDDTKRLTCITAYVHDRSASRECLWLPGSEEIARQAIHERRTVMHNGPDEASMHLPLLAAEGPIGALSLYRPIQEGGFHKRDLLLAQSLSSLAALVLSHASLIENSRHAADRAAKLANIAAHLGGPKPLEDVLETAADCLREMLAPSGVALVTLQESEPQSGQRVAATSYREAHWSEAAPHFRDLILPAEMPALQTLSRTLRPVHLEDLSQQAPELAPGGAQSALVLPLLDRDTLIGSLVLLSRQRDPFLDLDATLAKSLTERITAAVLSARLLEETRRRTQEIETLYDAAQDISRQRPDISGVLDRLLHRLLSILGADRGFVALFQNGEVVIPSQVSPIELPTHQPLPQNHEIFQTLVRTPGPLMVPDATQLRADQYPLLAALRARSLMLVPMFLDERLIGGIAIGTARERHFDEADRHLASSLAYLGALAVRNASYFANLEKEVATRTRDLAEANRQLQLLDQIRRNLLANVTHELRTPLSGILGYGEILEEELSTQLTDEQRSFMHELLSEGYHLRDLINTMIDMSQLATGTLALDRQPVSLELLTHQVCETYSKLAEAKGITFTCDCEEQLPYVDADPSRAYQVLGHLLTNALKFTASGGQVWLRVTTVQSDHRPMVCVEVKDTGIGIPSEKLPLLFTSFFQADPSATRQFGGLGLGLSLSKHLVELHGGRIWAESTEGKGSTFGFTLPVWQDTDQS
ncbi:MAG TPA: GAF domain-containing protein [Stenomitos sp.]